MFIAPRHFAQRDGFQRTFLPLIGLSMHFFEIFIEGLYLSVEVWNALTLPSTTVSELA